MSKRQASKKQHLRRCLVCRVSDQKSELLRFVRSGNELRVDREHCLPGRGAYVHKRFSCVVKTSDLKIWQRAFRTEGALDPTQVGSVMRELSAEFAMI